MEVRGLGWLGIRTERFEETARFFGDAMGLETVRQERDVVGFPDGVGMGVWRPEDESHGFFGAGPVVGFLVEGVGAACARMEAADVAFIGPVQRSGDAAWGRFRGPDGNVYEIIEKA